MSNPRPKVRARHYQWTRQDGNVVDVIRINSYNSTIIVPYDKARHLVDMVHDLCDEHERETREQQ